MSNNNDSGKFFKFKNLQLVRRQNPARQTRQNTDIRTQGMAEEQFAAIAAAAHAEVLNDIDDILTDDMRVLTTRRQNNNLWNHKFRYKIIINKVLTLMKLTIVHLKVLQTVHWTLRV